MSIYVPTLKSDCIALELVSQADIMRLEVAAATANTPEAILVKFARPLQSKCVELAQFAMLRCVLWTPETD